MKHHLAPHAPVGAAAGAAVLVALVLFSVAGPGSVAQASADPVDVLTEPAPAADMPPESDTADGEADDTDSLAFWVLFTAAGVVLIVSGAVVLRRTRHPRSP